MLVILTRPMLSLYVYAGHTTRSVDVNLWAAAPLATVSVAIRTHALLMRVWQRASD